MSTDFTEYKAEGHAGGNPHGLNLRLEEALLASRIDPSIVEMGVELTKLRKKLKEAENAASLQKTSRKDVEYVLEEEIKRLWQRNAELVREKKTRSKQEFLEEYVLNRANTEESLDGVGAAIVASRAWDKIEEACKEV